MPDADDDAAIPINRGFLLFQQASERASILHWSENTDNRLWVASGPPEKDAVGRGERGEADAPSRVEVEVRNEGGGRRVRPNTVRGHTWGRRKE